MTAHRPFDEPGRAVKAGATAFRIIRRAAIVLSVGWSAFALWFAHSTASDPDTFHVWRPPGPPTSVVVAEQDEALRRAHEAGDVEAAQVIENVIHIVRRQEVAYQNKVRAKVIGFAAFSIGVVWAIPIAAVWALVWIASPLRGAGR